MDTDLSDQKKKKKKRKQKAKLQEANTQAHETAVANRLL